MTTTARDEMQSIGAVVVAGSTGKVGQILLQPRSGGIGKVGTEVPGKRKWRNRSPLLADGTSFVTTSENRKDGQPPMSALACLQQLLSPFLRYPRLPYG